MRTKCAFIMQAYNAERYIKPAIDSVLNQTEENIILIINDNGSTDGTKEICREYKQKDERVFLFRTEDNRILFDKEKQDYFLRIIEQTDSEYFTYIDADDLYDKKFTELTYRTAREQDAQLVVCGWRGVTDRNEPVYQIVSPYVVIQNGKMTLEQYKQIYASLSGLWGRLYHRSLSRMLHDVLIGIPHTMRNSGDVYTTMKMFPFIKKSVFLPAVMYTYLLHSNSNSHKRRITEITPIWPSAYFEFSLKILRANGLTDRDSIIFAMSKYTEKTENAMKYIYEDKMTGPAEKLEYLIQMMKNRYFHVLSKVHNRITFRMYDLINELRAQCVTEEEKRKWEKTLENGDRMKTGPKDCWKRNRLKRFLVKGNPVKIALVEWNKAVSKISRQPSGVLDTCLLRRAYKLKKGDREGLWNILEEGKDAF